MTTMTAAYRGGMCTHGIYRDTRCFVCEPAALFAFEVPTSMGRFRIIGPDTLPPEEAAKVAAQIARLLPLLLLEPDLSGGTE